VLDVAVELARDVPDRLAVARAQDREVERPQAAQAVEVAGEVAGHEHAALAEHRVADERGAAAHEREMVVGVAGQRDDPQRADQLAVGRARTGRDHGHLPHAGKQPGQTLDVVLVVMGHRHARHLTGGGDHRVEVRVDRRAGIHDPVVDDPRVGAGQGKRARVVRADQDDAAIRQRPHGQRGTSRKTGPLSDTA
jgi:hypothetical protein